MKPRNSLSAAVSFIIGFALLRVMSVFGYSQEYTFALPLQSDSYNLNTMEFYLQHNQTGTTSANNNGGFIASLTGLSETIYLDPVANTLRQVGTLSLDQTFSVGQYAGFQVVNDQDIPYQLAITQVVQGITFDTGPRPYTNIAGSLSYSFDSRVQLNMGVIVFYSLETGGAVINGSFSYTEYRDGVVRRGYPYTFSTFSTDGDFPSVLQMSGGLVMQGEQFEAFRASNGGSVSAPNGVSFDFTPGEAGDHTDWFRWGSNGDVYASLVPEPTPVSLLVTLGGCLRLFRRRKRVGPHQRLQDQTVRELSA